MPRLWVAAAVGVVVGLLSGCSKQGCLDGESGCKVPSPCQQVKFECTTDTLEIKVINAPSDRPGGWNSLGTRGDVLLGNNQAVAVIAAIGNQNHLDPNGGSLLDLASRDKHNDGLNQVVQIVGILPGDAARYDQLEIIDERPERVAVQVSGRLDGVPDARIYTLYEVRPCDSGIRVRTEIVNGTTDQQLWYLADGMYWAGREALPFTSTPGEGFAHPSFNLLTINDAFRKTPFVAASSHSAPYASYSFTSCSAPVTEGFQSDEVSASGLPRRVVPPRDWLTYERFFAVTPDQDIAGAASLALEVRRQAYGEKFRTVRGKVERAGAMGIDNERATSILISAGAATEPVEQRTPWSQVVPQADGTFSARVPAGGPYLIEVHSFGTKVLEKQLDSVEHDADVGTLVLPSTGRVTFVVTDALSGENLDAEIFVVPADSATAQATAGRFHGRFAECAPWLGPPPGGSPACNRLLVHDGRATTEIPLGRYLFYAFHGPFWTLAQVRATLTSAPQVQPMQLQRLPVQPGSTLSADFHVHGAASFDSSIPDTDRVLSFAASDVEVIVATDHDVVYDYSDVVRQLGLSAKISTVAGVETTGMIPFMYIPGYGFPLVIGHYNFWPLRYDTMLARNGGPFDEFIEPGELFDRVDSLYTGNGVNQLNHPWAEPNFGRDMGFPRALSLSTLADLPDHDDGTSAGMYVRAPKGGHRNNDHDAQEVMNGSGNEQLAQYRAFWFFTLNQGQLKTGTANSDSHSLTDGTVGVPRNLVYTATQPGPGFSVDSMNAAVKAGRVQGTNGPVIEARIDDSTGTPHSFGMTPFRPDAGARVHVKVSAAPWVPVSEIRFVVNGEVVKTISGASLASPDDAFGTTGLLRFQGEVPLAQLVTGTQDAWLVIEAGLALPLTADLGGSLDGSPDGIPDTTDNNHDGMVDAADVAAGKKIGPLVNYEVPADESHPNFHFAHVTGGYPFAFTNPFLLDLDGNGKFNAPLVKKGN